MNRFILPIAAVALSALALQNQTSTVPYTDIGTRIQVLGQFGSPLGSYLKLEGKRQGTAMHNAMNVAGDFLVERVNGVKLATPRMMWIDQVAKYPEGTDCLVRGYESGEMIGVPAEVTKNEGGAGSQT